MRKPKTTPETAPVVAPVAAAPVAAAPVAPETNVASIIVNRNADKIMSLILPDGIKLKKKQKSALLAFDNVAYDKAQITELRELAKNLNLRVEVSKKTPAPKPEPQPKYSVVIDDVTYTEYKPRTLLGTLVALLPTEKKARKKFEKSPELHLVTYSDDVMSILINTATRDYFDVGTSELRNRQLLPYNYDKQEYLSDTPYATVIFVRAAVDAKSSDAE